MEPSIMYSGDLEKDETLLEIWNAVQETNRNLEKCNKIISAFADQKSVHQDATQASISLTSSHYQESSRRKDEAINNEAHLKMAELLIMAPPNACMQKTHANGASEDFGNLNMCTYTRQEKDFKKRKSTPVTSTRKSNQPSYSKKDISPSARKIWQERNKKLKAKIRLLKNEVKARDVRVTLLEDAVGSLSDLCTQSQHAYYVLLHELARQLFQTAAHLKIDTSELQPEQPEDHFNSNKLGRWFETLYILSRRVKEEIMSQKIEKTKIVAERGASVLAIEEINNNDSLEERLLRIMCKLQSNLVFSRSN